MKKSIPVIIIVVIFLAGASVFIYPTVSNYLYEKNSSKAIVNHEARVSDLSEEYLTREKKAVARYNDSLFRNPVVLTDPFDPDAYPVTDGCYEELLALDEVMGYVEIPVISVNLPIYHSTTSEVLQKGVGHLENTSLPMGGESTHTVLSAHRGLPNARLFTDLNLVQVGNIFRVSVLDEVMTYQVYSIETVEPKDSASLHIEAGQDLVTLITCTPYGVNSHRLLVHGRRITEEAAAEVVEPQPPKTLTWEDYAMFAAIGIAAVFAVVLVVTVISGIVRRRRKKS